MHNPIIRVAVITSNAAIILTPGSAICVVKDMTINIMYHAVADTAVELWIPPYTYTFAIARRNRSGADTGIATHTRKRRLMKYSFREMTADARFEDTAVETRRSVGAVLESRLHLLTTNSSPSRFAIKTRMWSRL